MPSITFEGQLYHLGQEESVLEALLRNGIKAPHSCRAGSCGSCLMRAAEGTVPVQAQSGLKDSWKAQGYFLACMCRPEVDMVVAPAGADAHLGATITALKLLSQDVLQVQLRCDAQIGFRAGQYITLLRGGGLARSYSIASLPVASEIELHVRKIAGGKMSGWLHEQARVGERVSVVGPSGECFYVPGKEEQPLLLVGTGTGLAPLYGILRDALQHGHRGPIHLFHGALHKSGLDLVEELRRLAAGHSNVAYTAAVLNGAETDDVAVGPIDQVVLKGLPKLSGWRGYVCGDPSLVRSLKKKLFLSGMASRDIFADAFTPSTPTA